MAEKTRIEKTLKKEKKLKMNQHEITKLKKMKETKLTTKTSSAYQFDSCTVDKHIEVPELILKECNSTSLIFEIYCSVEDGEEFQIQQTLKRGNQSFQNVDVSHNKIVYIAKLIPNTEYYFRTRVKTSKFRVSKWSESQLVRTIKTHAFSKLL